MAEIPEQPPSSVPKGQSPERPEPDSPSVDNALIENLIHPKSHFFCKQCGNQLPDGSTLLVCNHCDTARPLPVAEIARTLSTLRCHNCGLNLVDVRTEDRCPKCGTSSAESVVVANRNPPSKVWLACAIAWPLFLLALSLLSMLVLGERDSFLYITGITLALIANAINRPIVSSVITRKYIPRYRRGRTYKNMVSLGTLVALAWVLSLLITILMFVGILLGVLAITLIFGACFMPRR